MILHLSKMLFLEKYAQEGLQSGSCLCTIFPEKTDRFENPPSWVFSCRDGWMLGVESIAWMIGDLSYQSSALLHFKIYPVFALAWGVH